MSLTWPWALIGLLALPALWGFRWWMRRRRRRDTLRVSSVTLIRAALPGRSAWRRRLPLYLFAAGLLVLGVGAARPQASVLVPSESSSILLAVDVSTSMCSNDVEPNRLTAAQGAAREFIQAQEDGTKIGLVGFSGIAALLVEPTTDKDVLLAAVDGLRTSRGTAIGLGILTAIDAIAEINPNVAPTGIELPPGATPAEGNFEPDTIVVLTDGANTQGVDPVTAAEQAAARRLRVYTIGFGTTQPARFVCTADQIADNGGFGGGGGRPGRGGRNQGIDVATLTQVAASTGGEYFEAADAEALTDTLLDLPSTIVLQREDVELTVWAALAGALLVLAAVGLTQWWNRGSPSPAPAGGPPGAGPPAPLPSNRYPPVGRPGTGPPSGRSQSQ
jgi:Ca-activated chloride channel family protein